MTPLHLLLLSTVAFAPGHPEKIFLPTTTVSWSVNDVFIHNGIPIDFYNPYGGPPLAGEPNWQPWEPFGDPATREAAETGTVGGLVTAVCFNSDGPCEMDLATEPTNWSTIFEVVIGVQFEGWEHFDYEGSTIGGVAETIRHIQAAFQHVNAIMSREVGLVFRVGHIYLREQYSYDIDSPTPDLESDADTKDVWKNQLGMLGPMPKHVVRIRMGGGSYAIHDSLCPTAPFAPSLSHVTFWPSGDISKHGRYHVLIHELTHVVGPHHTQCYQYANGVPVERCTDTNCYPSYAGPQVCPPTDELSFIGYCWPCYYEPHAPWHRLGPIAGPMQRIGRNHVLAWADVPECLLPIDYRVSFSVFDADNDGIYWGEDNCEFTENHTQLDFDVDGRGDNCDGGCQIGTYHGTAWPLAIVTLFLFVARRKSRWR